MTELQRQTYDFNKLLAKIQTAGHVLDLEIYGAQAMTAAEEDKPKLREAYRRRLDELRAK